jgi:cyclic lactone autoinducer peptide
MKRYMILATYAVLASVVTELAVFFASKGSASWFILHQPATPKCLSK